MCCALPLASASGIYCARCVHRPRFQSATVPWLYSGDMPALIHAFKFHAALPAATLLAELLGRVFQPQPSSWLLTVPQHPQRARQRGFDHIDWLASLCPTMRHLPRVSVSRCQHTPSLRHLNRRQRFKLTRNAFELHDSVNGKHIVLLDDVMTTGATLHSLAKLCYQHGAKSVEVVAIARTPPFAWDEKA